MKVACFGAHICKIMGIEGSILNCGSHLLTGLKIYHSHVRPHLGLGGKTPGEVAGIHIEGDNKYCTIIQAATAKATAG